ncbi:hypothetical protein CGLAMM_09245 [Acetobacteraceae bacterium EV16G]
MATQHGMQERRRKRLRFQLRRKSGGTRLTTLVLNFDSTLRRLLSGTTVLGKGVMRHDIAFKDPDLHTASAIGRLCRCHAVINIRTKRMKRHATFTVDRGVSLSRPCQGPC